MEIRVRTTYSSKAINGMIQWDNDLLWIITLFHYSTFDEIKKKQKNSAVISWLVQRKSIQLSRQIRMDRNQHKIEKSKKKKIETARIFQLSIDWNISTWDKYLQYALSKFRRNCAIFGPKN